EGVESTIFSLAGPRARHQGPVCPNASPQTADHGLPIRFCQTPLPSLLVWIDFPAPTASAIPPEATAQRSAGAYCQTTVSSDGSPPTAANNSGHVSPAVHPSSPAAAASWSATSSRFAWATPAAATNCPSCKPAHSIPAVPGLSGNDDNSVASSSPLAFLFDPLLCRSAFVVEAHHAPAGCLQVGHDESDSGEQLPEVELHFRHHPSCRLPARGLVEEALV